MIAIVLLRETKSCTFWITRQLPQDAYMDMKLYK